MLSKAIKGKSVGKIIRRMEYKGSDIYDVIIDFFDNNRAECGTMTESTPLKSENPMWRCGILPDIYWRKFDILEDKYETLTPNFNRENLLKGFIVQEREDRNEESPWVVICSICWNFLLYLRCSWEKIRKMIIKKLQCNELTRTGSPIVKYVWCICGW